MMEKEYDDLIKQEYILVKHGGLSRNEVARMTGEDRIKWIKLMNEEREKEEQAMKKSKKSPKNLNGLN